MTINHLNIPRGGAYTAPSAEEIAIEQSACLCLSDLDSLEIPETPETEDTWDL